VTAAHIFRRVNAAVFAADLWVALERYPEVSSIGVKGNHGFDQGPSCVGRTLRQNRGCGLRLPLLWHLGPTLRKWWRRYQADGEAGLAERSRRPHQLATQKVLLIRKP
jgi:hypothetical protein